MLQGALIYQQIYVLLLALFPTSHTEINQSSMARIWFKKLYISVIKPKLVIYTISACFLVFTITAYMNKPPSTIIQS